MYASAAGSTRHSPPTPMSSSCRPWPAAGAERVFAPPRPTAPCRTVGGTPLVELTRLSPAPDVRLYAKLEWFNPTGSVKDRVACAMLDAAAAAGELWPGGGIPEPPRGHTRLALAVQGRPRGHRGSIVLPAGPAP